jgi:hypothetical protein
MLEDPQRLNLYAYVRNNPLRLTDPTGEAISLAMDPGLTLAQQLVKVIEALAALQAMAGRGGSQLGFYYDNASGQWRVKILGDIAAFRKISLATNALADMVESSEVVNFQRVAPYELLPIEDERGVPRTLATANGASQRDSSRQLWIFVRRAYNCCESEAGSDFGRFTLWGALDFLGLTDVSADAGTVTAHEVGHGMYFLKIGPKGNYDAEASNRSALDLENAVRRAKDPNGPQREHHP